MNDALAALDVVLSDVRMPDMDGIAFLKLLRERAPSVDVILGSPSPSSAGASGCSGPGRSSFIAPL
jgi:CheY-like chemotaxis protein